MMRRPLHWGTIRLLMDRATRASGTHRWCGWTVHQVNAQRSCHLRLLLLLFPTELGVRIAGRPAAFAASTVAAHTGGSDHVRAEQRCRIAENGSGCALIDTSLEGVDPEVIQIQRHLLHVSLRLHG